MKKIKSSLPGITVAVHLLAMAVLLQGLCVHKNHDAVFEGFLQAFHQEYSALNIPAVEFDYRDNFAHIAASDQLEKQKIFFKKVKEKLKSFDPKKFTRTNKLHYDHLVYQVELNEERISLETAYRKKNSTPLPANGLSELDEQWYAYYIKFHTSVDTDPEALFAFGKKEVEKVQGEIMKIRTAMGYANDSAGFYAHINSNARFLSEKDSVVARYEKIKTRVLKNMDRLFDDTRVNPLLFMEWPDAGKYTPPGYYSPADDNAFDQGIYYFNFYDHRHNTRAMDWLFMHEGIPGHHYQWVMRSRIEKIPDFVSDFYYPGNFEGWGAYVEYLGKEVGLYQTPEAYLGKWEWDLVRSVRILLDVGIHHYGWSEKEALACWKKYIPNQDEIAEREVKRCTNWPAQALSYKVGADHIWQLRERLQKKNANFSIKKFHTAYLRMGSAPMEVMEKNIEAFMK